MSSERNLSTSPTLLGRLSRVPTDEAAWSDFAERYGRRIFGWCRQWRLQEADAEDVTQQVLLKLAHTMRSFPYDSSKSFRAWLKTVTHHAWRDFVSSKSRSVVGTGDTRVSELLESVPAGKDLVDRLDEEFARDLVDEAMARVRLRVHAHTWQAFHLLTVDGLSGALAAKKLGMKVATVFVARSKVQKMIQSEVRKLQGNEA